MDNDIGYILLDCVAWTQYNKLALLEGFELKSLLVARVDNFAERSCFIDF